MEIFITEIQQLLISEYLYNVPYEIDPEYLPSLDFTVIGLTSSTPKYGLKGIKESADYLNSNNQIVVSKKFTYDFSSEKKGVYIKFQWFKNDGSIGVTKTEFKPLNIVEIEKIKKSNRKRSITYLQASSYGTPIEPYVKALFTYYFNSVILFEEAGTMDFKNNIENENVEPYKSYLDIVVDSKGKTVKQAILLQI